VIILQETPCQAIARWFSQAFKIVITEQAIRTPINGGTGALGVP
jgi:hypothetical protein